MAETLTVNDTPQQEGLTAEEQDSLQVGEQMAEEQGELLAGKYKNAEELEQAYVELQKKLASDAAKRNALVSSGDRSAKIRTYNYPQGRVTDHRIGLTLYDLPNIMNGDIQKLIDELLLYQNTQKMKEAGEEVL